MANREVSLRMRYRSEQLLGYLKRAAAMGAESYAYYVPYEKNVQHALESLRTRVFERGEFNGFELAPSTPEEAFELMDTDGTASILDIQQVADQPNFFCAAPFTLDELQAHFGTDQPTRTEIESGDGFWNTLERGQARYVVVYQDEQPAEIYFAGYSFD